METFKEGFVGREKLLKAVLLKLQQSSGGLVVLTGKPGTGKSALMVSETHSVLYVSVAKHKTDNFSSLAVELFYSCTKPSV